ncbi:hypothetical protein ABIE13_002934 [Ottowia thiooxydans]|uniref:Uncharacterized protein n=1 Tax=Ottowia thiooxydans TaxID=219182 RepID=A0ABV2Q9V4_9BURK
MRLGQPLFVMPICTRAVDGSFGSTVTAMTRVRTFAPETSAHHV